LPIADRLSEERINLAIAMSTLYVEICDTGFERYHSIRRCQTSGNIDVELKSREVEIFTWAVAGKTLEDISDITNLSYATVRYHLANARERYGYATNQQAIVRAAIDYQLDPLGPVNITNLEQD
jgi:DNA-binding CsgD family transcriptional regulator